MGGFELEQQAAKYDYSSSTTFSTQTFKMFKLNFGFGFQTSYNNYLIW